MLRGASRDRANCNVNYKFESRPRPPFIQPLCYINKEELDFIYKEVVVDQCYTSRMHGVAVREGDVAVDVGVRMLAYLHYGPLIEQGRVDGWLPSKPLLSSPRRSK